jgi:hypothetical protein
VGTVVSTGAVVSGTVVTMGAVVSGTVGSVVLAGVVAAAVVAGGSTTTVMQAVSEKHRITSMIAAVSFLRVLMFIIYPPKKNDLGFVSPHLLIIRCNRRKGFISEKIK